MLVSDVMTTDLVTVDVDATLRTVAEELLTAHVGSVIVSRDGEPTGIVTETDVVHAGYVTDDPFSAIAVEAVMSSPLETIQPSTTARQAVRRMTDEGVKKLPVLDGMDLVGIVTVSDVSSHYTDFVREAHEIDAQRDGWEGERLREEDIRDLSRRE
ncbi:CBS domain-containing protein [Halobacteriales archaeon Cl-PHB]